MEAALEPTRVRCPLVVLLPFFERFFCAKLQQLSTNVFRNKANICICAGFSTSFFDVIFSFSLSLFLAVVYIYYLMMIFSVSFWIYVFAGVTQLSAERRAKRTPHAYVFVKRTMTPVCQLYSTIIEAVRRNCLLYIKFNESRRKEFHCWHRMS